MERRAVWESLRHHWPEYAIEALGIAAFVLVAGGVACALEYAGSPLRRALPNDDLRRALFAVSAGLMTVALVYSPWGQRSGAHFNPAVTLTFWRLGKVSHWDHGYYVA